MAGMMTVRFEWPVLEQLTVYGSCPQMHDVFPVVPEGAVAACAAGLEAEEVCTSQSLLQ